MGTSETGAEARGDGEGEDGFDDDVDDFWDFCGADFDGLEDLVERVVCIQHHVLWVLGVVLGFRVLEFSAIQIFALL